MARAELDGRVQSAVTGPEKSPASEPAPDPVEPAARLNGAALPGGNGLPGTAYEAGSPPPTADAPRRRQARGACGYLSSWSDTAASATAATLVTAAPRRAALPTIPGRVG